jgi:hypothetical protein
VIVITITVVKSSSSGRFKRTLFSMAEHLRGPFAKFVDPRYYSESELRGGAVTVSFSKYLPWKTMHFLQRSTHYYVIPTTTTWHNVTASLCITAAHCLQSTNLSNGLVAFTSLPVLHVVCHSGSQLFPIHAPREGH